MPDKTQQAHYSPPPIAPRQTREEVTDILAEALLVLVLSGRPASPLVSAKKKRATGMGSNVASA